MMPPLQLRICLLALSIGLGSAATADAQVQGPGHYTSGSDQLYLTRQGNFLYQWAFDIAGRGVNLTLQGAWKKRADGSICLEPRDGPPVLALALHDPGLSPDLRVLIVEKDVGEAVLIAVGHESSTPALSQWRNTRSWGEEERGIDAAATHLFVQVPDREASTILTVPLQAGYNRYRLVAGQEGRSVAMLEMLATLADSTAVAPVNPCLDLGAIAFVRQNKLGKQVNDALDASIRELLDPDQVEVDEVSVPVLKPVARTSAPRPVSVLRYTTGVDDAGKLYVAITAAFNEFAPSSSTFNQYEADRARSDRTAGVVVGHAGGNRSASDFEISVQVGNAGEIQITTRAMQPLPEINAEDDKGYEMASRIGYILGRSLDQISGPATASPP